MGFFEFLGESRNPGPTGSIHRRKSDPEPPKKNWIVVLWGLGSIAAISALLYWMIESASSTTVLLIGIVLLAGYLFAGFNLRVRLPSGNFGMWGTPIDHPFRFSDDMNRFLAFVSVVLLPGRFLSEGIYHFYKLVAGS